MESITDFIYTGSISPTRNNVLQLLRTAIHFDITGKHFSLKIPVLGFLLLYDKIHKSPTTHQEPVVWKLTQVQAAGPRCVCGQRTIYSYFTSNANGWAPSRMFSYIKYEHFVQVSSNHKHIFIMFADVRCGQKSISKEPWCILPVIAHTFRRVRK